MNDLETETFFDSEWVGWYVEFWGPLPCTSRNGVITALLFCRKNVWHVATKVSVGQPVRDLEYAVTHSDGIMCAQCMYDHANGTTKLARS